METTGVEVLLSVADVQVRAAGMAVESLMVSLRNLAADTSTSEL